MDPEKKRAELTRMYRAQLAGMDGLDLGALAEILTDMLIELRDLGKRVDEMATVPLDIPTYWRHTTPGIKEDSLMSTA